MRLSSVESVHACKLSRSTTQRLGLEGATRSTVFTSARSVSRPQAADMSLMLSMVHTTMRSAASMS